MSVAHLKIDGSDLAFSPEALLAENCSIAAVDIGVKGLNEDSLLCPKLL
jgi:hypothetical protein